MSQPLISFVSPALALAIALPLDAQRRRPEMKMPELEQGTYQTGSFETDALKEGEATYGIYLPKGYEEEANHERRYPLVIWLHGMWEDHRRFFVRGGVPVLEKMIADGRVPEVILVTANGGRSSFYTNCADGNGYQDLITDDLLREVTTKYRVREGREHRALIGVSMGGYGALKIAMKKPQLFGAITAHSAAVMPRRHEDLEEAFPWLKRYGGAQRALGAVFGSPIDDAKWESENLLLLAEKMKPADLHGLRLHFDCGTADRYNLAGPNEELHALLAERKIEHGWQLIEDGGHGWRTGYNQGAVERAFTFLAEAWKSGEKDKGDADDASADRKAPKKH